MILRMVKVFIHGQVELDMKATIEMVKKMDMEYISTKMETNTKAIGRMTNKKVKANSPGQVALDMKEIILKV